MKNPIFLVIIYILLKSILITFAKTNPESNMYEDTNAILIPCSKNSANNTCEPHLIINIHMNPSPDLNNLEDSWILDEVYDPTKRALSKIISPYLIVVGRGEPVVMYPLQYEESIKHKELGEEQQSKDDDKNPKGLPSSQSDGPRPSINMKDREEVKDVKGSPSPKTDQPLHLINLKERGNEPTREDDPNKLNPSITMKRIVDGKDLQVYPSDQNNEPRPSASHQKNESSSFPSDQNNEPRPSINMSEREDEQATKDIAKGIQNFPSFKTDEPSPSLNSKEREDEQATNGDFMAKPGIQSIKTKEPNSTIIEPVPSVTINEREGEQATGNEIKNVQDSQSLKTDKPLPSINVNEWEYEQPTEDVVNDSHGLRSSNTNPAINTEVSEGDEVQGFPFGLNNEPVSSMSVNEREDEKPRENDIKDSQLQSSKSNDPPNSINIKELEDVEETKSSPFGETKEPINMEKHDESEDLHGPSSDKTIDINVKGREEPIEDDVKNLQDSLSRNASESDASRLKRHQGLVYSSKKSVGFNIAFLQKTPRKNTNTNWNSQEPFSQSGIAGLGLIEVKDPSSKKPSMEIPKELQGVHNKIQKYSKKKDDKKNVFRSYQYNNRELDMKDGKKVDQIEKDRKASMHNTGTWDNQLLDTNLKKNFYQEGMERDYHLERISHPDNIKEKDVTVNDQIEQKDKRKRIEEEIKNYKPSFKTQENLLAYNLQSENHAKSIGSYSNDNNFSPEIQSIHGFPHEKEGNHNFKSHDTILSRVNDCPYNSLFEIDKGPDIRQNYMYAFKQPLNVPTDLNDRKGEYCNAKVDDHQIYTENYLPEKSVAELDIKNKYYNVNAKKKNIYKGNYLPEVRVPDEGIKNEYYNPKTIENIYKGNDFLGKVPEYEIKNKYYNSKTPANKIYTGNDLPQGRFPELERNPEYYNAKVADNSNALPQGRFPELDRKNDYNNAKTANNNIFIKKYLPT